MIEKKAEQKKANISPDRSPGSKLKGLITKTKKRSLEAKAKREERLSKSVRERGFEVVDVEKINSLAELISAIRKLANKNAKKSPETEHLFREVASKLEAPENASFSESMDNKAILDFNISLKDEVQYGKKSAKNFIDKLRAAFGLLSAHKDIFIKVNFVEATGLIPEFYQVSVKLPKDWVKEKKHGHEKTLPKLDLEQMLPGIFVGELAALIENNISGEVGERYKDLLQELAKKLKGKKVEISKSRKQKSLIVRLKVNDDFDNEAFDEILKGINFGQGLTASSVIYRDSGPNREIMVLFDNKRMSGFSKLA